MTYTAVPPLTTFERVPLWMGFAKMEQEFWPTQERTD